MTVSVSFGGAGHHFPFMLGAAYALRYYFGEEVWRDAYVHASSGGCAGAISLLLHTSEEIQTIATKAMVLAHQPLPNYYLTLTKHLLPIATWRKVGDRLVIGSSDLLTPVLHHGGYNSQAELLSHLAATCRIPFFTGGLQRELDGGFSHRYAMVDENTIVITLRKKRKSDIYSRSTLPFQETLLASPSLMWKLYEEGIREVERNLDLLKGKVERGMRTRGEVLFYPCM